MNIFSTTNHFNLFLQKEKILFLLPLIRNAIIGSYINFTVILLLLLYDFSYEIPLIWYSVNLVILSIRLYINNKLTYSLRKKKNVNLQKLKHIIYFGVLIQGLLFGTVIFFYFGGTLLYSFIAITLIAVGHVAGTMTISSQIGLIYFLLYSMPTLIPISFVFFSIDDFSSKVVGFLIYFFILFLAYTIKSLNNLYVTKQKKFFFKVLLLKRIASKKRIIEKLNRKLKKIIIYKNKQKFLLVKSYAKYRELVENSSDIIARVDKNFRYLYINPVIKKYFACLPAEIIGKSPQEIFFLGEHINEIESAFSSVINNRKNVEMNLKILTIIGYKTFYCRLSPEYDINNNVNFITVFIQDVTEQKIKEEKLIKEKEQAENANLSKNLFLASVIHDLKSPLTTMLGYSKLLTRPGVPLENVNDWASQIYSSGEKLVALINDLLDISTIEAGKVVINKEYFLLDEVLRDIEQIYSYKLTDKNVKLLLFKEFNIPSLVFSDKLRVSQILINLIDNAFKFTEEGNITVNIKKHKDIYLLFSVEDEGIGIDEESLSIIFNPFSQSKNINIKKYKGLGLGLSICKKLVNLLGGEIWVTSVLGEGSKFYFTIDISMVNCLEII